MITNSSRSMTLMVRDKCMTSEHHVENLFSVWKGWGVLCSDHPFLYCELYKFIDGNFIRVCNSTDVCAPVKHSFRMWNFDKMSFKVGREMILPLYVLFMKYRNRFIDFLKGCFLTREFIKIVLKPNYHLSVGHQKK